MKENTNEELFNSLVYTFNLTAMQQLGKVPNSLTGEREKDLEQASLSIDMLTMLYEKTKNNLTVGEEAFLKQTLTQLQAVYLEEVQK